MTQDELKKGVAAHGGTAPESDLEKRVDGDRLIKVITPEVPEEVKRLAANLATTADALNAALRGHTAEGRAVVLTGLTTWLDNHKDGYKGFHELPDDKAVTKVVEAIAKEKEDKGEVADREAIREEVIRDGHYRKGLYEGYEYAQAVISAFVDAAL